MIKAFRYLKPFWLSVLMIVGLVFLQVQFDLALPDYMSDIVTYERFERLAGESKYPLKKMLALAWEGITSLSIQPIRIITWSGVVIFLISMVMVIYSLISFFVGAAVSGWASTLCSIWALGGLQLLAIGIIGEYIGKIYLETKRRPRFIVEKYLDD